MPQVEEQTPAIVEPSGVDPVVIHLPPSVRMTDDVFFEFCQINEDQMFERTAEGDIVIVPPPGWESSSQNLEICCQLQIWIRQDGSGLGSDSSGGYGLPNGAVRAPDAAWCLKSRLAAISPDRKRKHLPLCPDFMLELRSPGDRIRILQAKMHEYMENGARLGWLIDPFTRRIYVYRSGEAIQQLENPASISGDPVLPGFVLDLTKVW